MPLKNFYLEKPKKEYPERNNNFFNKQIQSRNELKCKVCSLKDEFRNRSNIQGMHVKIENTSSKTTFAEQKSEMIFKADIGRRILKKYAKNLNLSSVILQNPDVFYDRKEDTFSISLSKDQVIDFLEKNLNCTIPE